MLDIRIAATRGRDPDNPTSVRTRTFGRFVQTLELRQDRDTSNTITSVQKDNYVLIQYE